MQLLDVELDLNCLSHPVELFHEAVTSHLKSARFAPALEGHCNLTYCHEFANFPPLLGSVGRAALAPSIRDALSPNTPALAFCITGIRIFCITEIRLPFFVFQASENYLNMLGFCTTSKLKISL